MSKLIGVRSERIHDWLSQEKGYLKREFLFWNRIGITNLELTLPAVKQYCAQMYPGALDFMWLYERGYVFDVQIDPGRLEPSVRNAFLKANEEFTKLGSARFIPQAVPAELREIITRAASSYLNLEDENKAIPLFDDNSYQLILPGTRKHDVVEIVITRLPVPSPLTPYEQIFEYRSDAITERRFDGLKNWINKISHSDLTGSEITDELVELMHQYEEHLALHKIEYRYSTIKILVRALPDILENLVKVRLGNLAELFLQFKKTKLALFKDELKAPGREIAYIYYTTRNFS